MACNCNCGDPNDIIHIRRSELDALRQEIKRLEVECSISVEQGEKARKWDNLGSSQSTEFNLIVEKAKKWDSVVSTYWDGVTWNDILEKARKWDDFNTSPDVKKWLEEMSAKANEWKEKAKKWDEFENYFAAGGARNPGTILEKAEKWDEHIQRVKIEMARTHDIVYKTIPMDEYKNLEDKAVNWDEFENDGGYNKYMKVKEEFYKYKAKAKKWDEHIASQPCGEFTHHSQVYHVGIDAYKEMKETNRIKTDKLQRIRRILDGD